MSAFDFIWNAAQESKIIELEDRIQTLEEQNKVLYEWIQYFKQQLGDLSNGKSDRLL
jgi:hypothetical protein